MKTCLLFLSKFLLSPRDWEAPECYVTHQSDRFSFLAFVIVFVQTKSSFQTQKLSFLLCSIRYFSSIKYFIVLNSGIIFSKHNILVRQIVNLSPFFVFDSEIQIVWQRGSLELLPPGTAIGGADENRVLYKLWALFMTNLCDRIKQVYKA